MNIRRLWILALFCFPFSGDAQRTPAGKLFIIGGGSRPDAMVDRIIRESGLDQGGYGVILPMSSIEPDSSIYYASLQFTKRGVTNVYGLHFEKGRAYSQERIDSIRNARLVYISGGDQNRFMDVVRGTDIERAIHDAFQRGSVIGGTSAGAAVMSKVMITGNELKHPDYSSTFRTIESDNIETKPGLGLLEHAIVDQHFLWRSRHNRLISAVIEFPELKGIGIDESTAILVIGNEAEVVGVSQVILLENKKKSRVERSGKLGATGIRMSVLLPGDKFKVK